ncbi:cache domain-containing sensor histidine kinase [Paenibacillus camelliae]|uniref:cache domain-containing sensor histidine kinase n=1 Tax=Paenibacillus camelliae TaxID=512410 RepID=UPI00204217C9|nr:sensor histidine kinase [Paenibacillus camelliae]MCM3634300.1 histidine kinase [Paenibacillus camelliae]
MLRKFKIQHRLIGTFLVVSVIPILFLGYYAYKLYSESISDKLSASTYQAITLVNKNLLAELQNYQYLNGSISTNEFVQANLSNQLPQQVTETSKEAAMDAIFRTIFPAHVVTVSIYDTEHRPFYELGFETISNASLERAISDVDNNSPYDGLTYVRTARSYDTIAVGRKIHAEHDSSEQIGYAFVFVSADMFSKNILSSVDLGAGSKLVILGRDGTVLSASDKSVVLGEQYADQSLFKSINEQRARGVASFSGVIDAEDQQVSYIYNEQIGLYLVSLMPYSYINSEISHITTSIILISLVIIIVCIIIIYFMNNSIVRPIKGIIAFSNQISSGELSNRIHDDNDDEMSVLSRKINSMVSEIERLIDNQKLDERRKRELELQMLQSQINPHFLFNTLNTLRWLAVINQVPVLNNGISSLSELLRSTILDHNEEITIEQELENLAHYFEIQKIRYADRFQVHYEIDKELLHCFIPKLILQPVAENAIIHGISEHGKSIDILIRVQQVDQQLHIEIKDNGKGFDTNRFLQSDNANKLSGIGITNVNERIKLHYGEGFGLYISSAVGEGTSCKIILPIHQPEGG